MLDVKMFISCEKQLFYIFIFVVIVDINCKAANLKESLLSQTNTKRQKRAIDGNDLPPLPLTGGVNTDHRYPTTRETTTSSGETVNVGSDPQIEFRSHISSSRQDSSNQGPRDTPRTSDAGGYRYTSTVYSGPEIQTAYRYRPPYDQLGGQRYQNNLGGNQQRPYRGQQGSQYETGNTQYSPYVGSGVYYNPTNSRTRYVGTGSRYPLYNQNERVYGGSSSYIPNRGVVSNDPTCPTDTTNVYINNMGCTQAINTLGSFICYNYERVSRECCERCLSLKKAQNTGCEYGDWSYQCRNMEPFDCYNDRNRDICCETCRIHKDRQTQVIPGCEYGDLTPRCQVIREKRHLCYLPENQRLCCVTCPSLADQGSSGCEYGDWSYQRRNMEPFDCYSDRNRDIRSLNNHSCSIVCKWGDQNPELCTPFDQQNQLRINCYMPTVQQICCETCQRLKSRVREEVQGCEYGDRPVSFSTPYGILDCGLYIRRFGIEVCSNAEVAMHCCYTCYRYRTQPTSGKK